MSPAFKAFGVAAMIAAIAAAPAYAQRAASSPTAEGAEAASAAPPPPPGFPAPLGPDIVYGGEVDTHLQGELTSPSGRKSRVSVFDDTDLTLFANYKGWLSLNSDIKLERNRNDNLDSYYPDRNAAFRSEGLTLRQLYTTVRPADGLTVYAGKIHPNFGSAYEQAPGIFYNFGTDYEQDERVGGGIQYLIPVRLGPAMLGLQDVRATAEVFFLDTSVLSNSLFSRPGLDDPTASRLRRYSRDQYGPSNTGRPDSFTVSLRGGRPERGLFWQASVTRETTADPAGRTEFGQSIGASFDPNGDGIPIADRLGVTPFLEYAHFTNFAGIAGLERHYAVGGLAFTRARWSVNFAAGLRRSSGAATGTDHQENVSVTYEVLPRLLIGGGFNFASVGGKASRTLAPSLSYVRAF